MSTAPESAPALCLFVPLPDTIVRSMLPTDVAEKTTVVPWEIGGVRGCVAQTFDADVHRQLKRRFANSD
jgi:hypothetical protein